MLCSITKKSGQKVVARDVEKEDGPFCCPSCKAELNIRKGHIKQHHFAHKPPVHCNYGKGETEVHRKAKMSLYDAFHRRDDVNECELEKSLGEVRPDVYVVIRGTILAFELQISSLTIDEIIRRTKIYHIKKVPVLWLPIFTEKLREEKYSPKSWERWLHATYFGRVYYWHNGISVIPVHYDDYDLYVEETSWYSSDGDVRSAGGYYRKSKRWVTPKEGKMVQISSDFIIKNRKPWVGGNMKVPECILLMDKQDRWW